MAPRACAYTGMNHKTQTAFGLSAVSLLLLLMLINPTSIARHANQAAAVLGIISALWHAVQNPHKASNNLVRNNNHGSRYAASSMACVYSPRAAAPLHLARL